MINLILFRVSIPQTDALQIPRACEHRGGYVAAVRTIEAVLYDTAA